jgi:cysteine-rich repeat protein
MFGGFINALRDVRASDVVCGDAVLELPEACDDGNLKSGDGCSDLCAIELCGNNTVDQNEQCDDGNVRSGDGCNRYCQIEFCGDSALQTRRHEECDDGNGVSGDGCTSSCIIELLETAKTQSSTQTTKQNSTTVYSTLHLQTQTALGFLASPQGTPYIEDFSPQQLTDLKEILKKLGTGKRLTTQERDGIDELIALLRKAMAAERQRYLDILREFISTEISNDELENNRLQKEILLGDDIPAIISELEKMVATLSRAELKNRALKIISVLKGHGVDILEESSFDVDSTLSNGNRSIDVFLSIKTLKEMSELSATKDVAASFATIKTELHLLKESLPIFKQEYDIDPSDIEPLLSDIDALTLDISREGVDRMIVAIERLISTCEEKKIISRLDLEQFDERGMHAAATVQRLINDADMDVDGSALDIEKIIEELSQDAPLEARVAFEHGTTREQGKQILNFLENDTRVQTLQDILRKDGNETFDLRYAVLRAAITRVGTDNRDDTSCDDTMTDALRCTNEYLSDVQTAARSRSVYSRVIGTLQDYFEIK